MNFSNQLNPKTQTIWDSFYKGCRDEKYHAYARYYVIENLKRDIGLTDIQV